MVLVIEVIEVIRIYGPVMLPRGDNEDLEPGLVALVRMILRSQWAECIKGPIHLSARCGPPREDSISSFPTARGWVQ